MKTYIYTLAHPITQEIKYVGKTTNIKRRKYQHFNKKVSKSLSNKKLGNWLFKILNNNLKPILSIIDEVEEKWEEKEIYWINFYKEKGCDLCNYLEGGSGFSRNHTDETKIKMSKSQKGLKKDFSAENLEKLKERMRNNNPMFKEENKNKIKEKCLLNNSWKKTESFKENQRQIMLNRKTPLRNIAILQYDLEGNLIKEWSSIKEAATTLNFVQNYIIQCCKNKIKKYKNYVWKYK